MGPRGSRMMQFKGFLMSYRMDKLSIILTVLVKNLVWPNTSFTYYIFFTLNKYLKLIYIELFFSPQVCSGKNSHENKINISRNKMCKLFHRRVSWHILFLSWIIFNILSYSYKEIFTSRNYNYTKEKLPLL